MRRAISLLLLVAGCSFDSSGTGDTEAGDGSDGTDSSPGSTGVDSASASGPTTASASGTSSSTSSTSSTTDPSTTTSSSSDTLTTTAGTDTAGGDCGPELEVVVAKVEDATVTPPMETTMSQQGEGVVAFSPVDEAGTVDFAVSLPCNGTWYLWGRVYDQDPGTNQDDPDSYYVSPNGGPELTWFYGCETFNSPEWSWATVRNGVQGTDCSEGVRLEMNLPAGTHTFKFRNREGQNFFGATASIARIALVNLPEYMPTSE